ncbi:transglycosylase SLT domain-containing protein [Salinarimonas sp.]|uniref:transglycosylase SLT domain-containing protein n=1 Tax=Salinarimonas sp. TaxID=2766526 RepID=UPI0032D8C124
MFLFTTPPVSSSSPDGATPRPVLEAIRDGARANGLNFDYLLAAAQRESALDPQAKASTSSATGLFQFIEQTWLGLVKSDGARLGLADAARDVVQQADGSFAVADPARRAEILALREDPRVAARLAGALTAQNGAALALDLGREPSEADLAVAHVLGASGAARLIRAAAETPSASAADLFPRAAEANRSLFYDEAGAPRGAGELYRLIAAAHGRARDAAPSAAPAFAEGAPVAFARSGGPAFHGFFRTDTPSGPVSGAVKALWSAPPDGAAASPTRVAPSEAALVEVRARREARDAPLDLSAFTRVAR